MGMTPGVAKPDVECGGVIRKGECISDATLSHYRRKNCVRLGDKRNNTVGNSHRESTADVRAFCAASCVWNVLQHEVERPPGYGWKPHTAK